MGSKALFRWTYSREEHYVQLLPDAMKEGQRVENGWSIIIVSIELFMGCGGWLDYAVVGEVYHLSAISDDSTVLPGKFL